MQARTASQELLGLRRAVLALSNPVFSSGVQLTGGGDARDSEVMFPACFSLLVMLFAPDTYGTYQCSFAREEQSTYESNEKFFLPWPLKGVWNLMCLS